MDIELFELIIKLMFELIIKLMFELITNKILKLGIEIRLGKNF